jgi:dsDNA-specific endonuclease/ATPase MutS2
MKVSLDLHDIYNQGSKIEQALEQKFNEAVAKKSPLLEIIPGKGSGQLKKHVLRFLENKRSSMKNMRIEKPSQNFGTIKVHFNWNK